MPIYIEHARKSSDQVIKLTEIQKNYWVKHKYTKIKCFYMALITN